jgi:hemoglobin/transferrin/lactoferrin receptor protein
MIAAKRLALTPQHLIRMPHIPTILRSSFRLTSLSCALVSLANLPATAEQPERKIAGPNPSETESATVTTLPETVITSTATRTKKSIWDVPQAMTIVDREAIDRRQPCTPVEMLKEEPGVWAVSVAAQGTPIIRGLNGNRVLYLWDGVRINNGALFGGPNGFFNQFPIGAVDHMEIIRGGGSVQYGSDAIGGVINVFSKKAEFTDEFTIHGDLYGRYGSNDQENTQTLNLSLSGSRVAFAAGISRQEVGDYYGAGEGTLSPTGFNALGGYADLAFLLAPDHTLRLSWVGNERKDVESYVQSKLNANGVPRIFGPRENRGIFKLDYTAEDLGAWSSELKFYGYYQYYDQLRERRNQTASSFSTTTTDTDQDVFGIGLQNTTNAGKLQLTYGVDYRHEELGSKLSLRTRSNATGLTSVTEPAGNTPDGDYDVFSAFLSSEYRPFERLLLTAGVRYENTHLQSNPEALDVIPNAGYGLDLLEVDERWNSVVWNVGSIFSITKEWDLVANIGTAFRAPTYSDLLSAGTPVFSSRIASIPSPDLDPEKSITYELGTRVHSEKFTGTLNGYYTQLNDLIVQNESGTVEIPGQGTFIATRKGNSGEGYIAGVELALAYKPTPDWTFFANANYTYGQDEVANDPLRFIPPFNGVIGIRYEAPSRRWWVELTETWATRLTRHAPDDEQDAGFSRDPAFGSPNDTDNPPLRDNYDIPGFWITNLRGGIRVWERGDRSLDVTLSLNNVFNTSYREAYSQQQKVAPGFGAVIGARLTF